MSNFQENDLRSKTLAVALCREHGIHCHQCHYYHHQSPMLVIILILSHYEYITNVTATIFRRGSILGMKPQGSGLLMEVGSITMHDPDVMTMFVTDSMMLLVWLSYKICLKENANHQLVKISASTIRSGE